MPGRRSPLPSQIDPKLPAAVDDIFDLMTRDSCSERYSSVDDILADFDKIEGLGDVIDAQTQIVAAENPLKNIKFREPEEGESPVETSAEPESADDADGGEDKKSKYRPYSYQQRNKK